MQLQFGQQYTDAVIRLRDIEVHSLAGRVADWSDLEEHALTLQAVNAVKGEGNTPNYYTLHVWRRQDIVVAHGDIDGIMLTTSAPKAEGRVVLEKGTAEEFQQTSIQLRPANVFEFSDQQAVKAAADGAFAFPGCSPARYSLHVSVPLGLYVETIELNRHMTNKRLIDLSNSVGAEVTLNLKRGTATVARKLADDEKGAFVFAGSSRLEFGGLA